MFEVIRDKSSSLLSNLCLRCRDLTGGSGRSLCNQRFPTLNTFHATWLEVHDLRKLSDVVGDLTYSPSRLNQISAIEVSEYVLIEDGDESPKVVAAAAEWMRIGSDMVKILEHIQRTSGLESFSWKDCGGRGMRPAVFWEALWKTASTLKHLDMEFYVHELSDLGDTALPTVKFDVLKEVQLNATMCHGDTGVLVDKLLRSLPAVEDLTLHFPTCDLEGCRIQDITWEYTFPSLRVLTLSTYNSDGKALSDFLLRNPTITTLDWSVDADEYFILPSTCLPNLTTISLDCRYYREFVSKTVSILAACPVEHLKVSNCPYAGYTEIAKLAKGLKCLEIDPGRSGWRPDPDSDSSSEDEAEGKTKTVAVKGINDALEFGDSNMVTEVLPLHKTFRDLLQQLPGLQELAFDLDTGNILVSGGAGEGLTHPDAMNSDDLITGLALLPPAGNIRVLRLSDTRGLPLPNELLSDLPIVPESLEYLKWDTSEREVLYRIERIGGQVRASECESEKADTGIRKWHEARVLPIRTKGTQAAYTLES